MSEARNIRFTLNGRAVNVAVEPHPPIGFG